ncbi:MAG: metallophosphoesterase family protein [bacterium]|nr:metallophosphoesterase family protein [bacterium]
MTDLCTTFVTSDHHFFQRPDDFRFHSRLFGMTKPELDQMRIRLWNETVPVDGTIYYVGDFSDGTVLQTMELRRKLNGKIVLIRGNHDLFPIEALQAIFDDVADEKVLDINGSLVHLSHIPDTKRGKDMLRKYAKIVYGHVHEDYDLFPGLCGTFCSCVERNGNRPVSLRDVMAWHPHALQ